MSGEVSYFSRFLVKFTPMPVVTASPEREFGN
jgi:hypothetical protein